jgi:hypothetical protein
VGILRGAFFVGCVADLLRLKKGVTDNTLSHSVLSATIMFNPKKPPMGNEMVTNG